MDIHKDRVAIIHYRLTDGEGTEVVASEPDRPFAYVHGHRRLLPGLEEALEGRHPGERIHILVPPEKAFGRRDRHLLVPVPRDKFRGHDELEVGDRVHVMGPDGLDVMLVHAIQPDLVLMDANHPLAGETLGFEAEVLDVREARPEEVASGRVDGAAPEDD